MTSCSGLRSSPRLASKQRAVLLPLLKEKDTVIANLEEKIVDLEAKVMSGDGDKFKDVLAEKNQLEEDYKTLGERKLKLEEEVQTMSQDLQRCHDQILELEEKNMKLLDVLQTEQSRVTSLKSKVAKLSSADEEDTLENLIETFVEKVSFLCKDENLKISVSSENRNVKLKLTTRATHRHSWSLESSIHTKFGCFNTYLIYLAPGVNMAHACRFLLRISEALYDITLIRSGSICECLSQSVKSLCNY